MTLGNARKTEEGLQRVGGTTEFCRKEKGALGRWLVCKVLSAAAGRGDESEPGMVACAHNASQG